MNDHPGAVPGWNLALRFLLEMAALVGLGWAGWHLADGWLAPVLAVVLPLAGAAVWGVFAVPGDPSRNGNAPLPVPGWVRLLLELVVFAGGALGFALFGAVAVGVAMGVLILVHLAFSTARLRWLLAQR